jgi:hypothetical protein
MRKPLLGTAETLLSMWCGFGNFVPSDRGMRARAGSAVSAMPVIGAVCRLRTNSNLVDGTIWPMANGRAVVGKTLGDNWSNRGCDRRHSDVSAMQHRRSAKFLAPAHLAVGVSGAMLLLGAAESASAKGGSPSFYLNSFSLSDVRSTRAKQSPLYESVGVMRQHVPLACHLRGSSKGMNGKRC